MVINNNYKENPMVNNNQDSHVEITDISQLQLTLNSQRVQFNKTPYADYQTRIADLKKLKKMVIDNQDAFAMAMGNDFGHRSLDDSRIGDIMTTVMGINYSISKLKKWMKPKSRHVGILFQPAKAHVMMQPKGVIGIVTPWNYPLFLSLGPLTAALAAGNRAMIKMSEYTPATGKLLAELMATIFPQDKVAIVGGDIKVASAFTSLKFDHIFFTGSTPVGKIVMKSAAENLIPVTLELGGKSPTIIDKDINIDTAVSRMILGKTLNAGQTCVAPDYIFCPRDRVEELTNSLRDAYQKMFPTVRDNADATSVVNQGQYNRLHGLLEDAEGKGAKIIPLNESIEKNSQRKLPLTVVLNTTDHMKVMQEEIFGPVLPILPYDSIDEVIDYINANERPLALYINSYDKKFQQHILKHTHSGGACINDATFHVVIDDLPFGGVGASGMGNYHGEEGFTTFSHPKAVFSRGRISFSHLLFPPFGSAIHKLVFKLFIR
jgi:coniferyl-aldehyde dehydrogenase